MLTRLLAFQRQDDRQGASSQLGVEPEGCESEDEGLSRRRGEMEERKARGNDLV